MIETAASQRSWSYPRGRRCLWRSCSRSLRHGRLLGPAKSASGLLPRRELHGTHAGTLREDTVVKLGRPPTITGSTWSPVSRAFLGFFRASPQYQHESCGPMASTWACVIPGGTNRDACSIIARPSRCAMSVVREVTRDLRILTSRTPTMAPTTGPDPPIPPRYLPWHNRHQDLPQGPPVPVAVPAPGPPGVLHQVRVDPHVNRQPREPCGAVG